MDDTRTSVDERSAAAVELPRLADGLMLLGEYEGSGYTEPHYLAVRADGQVLHLSRLLHLVALAADGTHTPDQIAAAVSRAVGRELTADGAAYLLDDKLRPMGVLAPLGEQGTGASMRAVAGPGGSPLPPRATPPLALRARGTLLPARAVRVVSRALAPAYAAPVVLLVVLVAAVGDAWLLATADLAGALSAVLWSPTATLAVLGALLASTLVHELGHATACRAGGGVPGRIGVGLYVVYPAFFTDVTDSYRLDRIGRVRTDLGGVYFNLLTIVVLTGTYAVTAHPVVLVAIVLVHVEAIQQLLPLGRLDGYFVLADLAGVPDLFGRIGPILRSAIPGRPMPPMVAELRPGARRWVLAWVSVCVPVMVGLLAVALWQTPVMVRQVWAALAREWARLGAALATGDWPTAVLAVLSLLLLPLPLLGLAWLVGSVLRHLIALARRPRRVRPPSSHRASRPRKDRETPMSGSDDTRSSGARPLTLTHPSSTEATKSAPVGAHPIGAPTRAPDEPDRRADELVESWLLGDPEPVPTQGWRRIVHAASAGRVNPGPGPAEQRRFALLERVRTPIPGSRRIVVLSRKGGVGKTTTSLMLGHTFATHRGDRVVALDANPDAGSLALRLRRETRFTATDLLAERAYIERYAQLREFTSQDAHSRLEVVASDDDPGISRALGADDYTQLIDVLDKHFNLVIVDTGTGILDDAIQGILAEADQLVVVMAPAVDGGRVAAMTLDWLDQHGHGALVTGAIAVVNGVRGEGKIDLGRLREHFRARCRDVLEIPWDPALGDGGSCGLADVRPATRQAYLDLAAAIAEDFPATGRATLRSRS